MLASNFGTTEKDFSERIDLVQRFSCGSNLLDSGVPGGSVCINSDEPDSMRSDSIYPSHALATVGKNWGCK